MEIKCPKCTHEWETNSELNMVTCPSCQRKIDRNSNKKNLNINKNNNQEEV